jgi:SEC-C motif-containing protein
VTERCPCLSGEVYADCCGPYHRGAAHPPTAERLMRSRYSAFARGGAAYLLASWHPATRPESLELDPDLRWLSLEITGRRAGGVFDDEGEVSFVASYRATAARGGVLRGEQSERSRFEKLGGRWLYVGEAP